MQLKNLYRQYRTIVLLGLIAAVIGVVVGAIDTFFGKVLLTVTAVREANAVVLIPFLPIAGAGIIFLYSKWGKNCIKGMSLVFEAGHSRVQEIPARLVPLAIISTWLTHLFGGSAGREGVAVQIGATVAHVVGRRIHLENSTKILLVSGMAAGFAGLFQTPIAAVFFAIEVLTVGKLEYQALFPAVVASFSASFTSHLLGLEKFSVALGDSISFDWQLILKLALLGVLFGITGGLFAHTLHAAKEIFAKWFKNPMVRIVVIGIVISALSLLLYSGRYSGLGTNLISLSFGGEVFRFDYAFKFLLTIITLAAGFQGGEVTPLFSIGAAMGVVLAPVLGLPAAFTAALGYAGLFGSATNTLIAPMFIGAEVFGFQYLPYFFVVSAVSYVFNANKSIYLLQKQETSVEG